MILTICPNPSMDCTIELDNLNVGMLNRISNKVETYSGKALNVAMGVARLKEKSFATGFMFENNGKMFEQTLEREGVAHKFVWNKGSVRVNYKIIDKRSMLTEINDKGDEVSEEKQKELIELVRMLSKDCNIAVMSGSLPKGVSAQFYGEVLKVIPSGVKKIVDTEKNNLEYALKENVYLVKPNLRELENIAGESLTSKYDILKACYLLLNKGVKMVMVSLGSEGATGSKAIIARARTSRSIPRWARGIPWSLPLVCRSKRARIWKSFCAVRLRRERRQSLPAAQISFIKINTKRYTKKFTSNRFKKLSKNPRGRAGFFM